MNARIKTSEKTSINLDKIQSKLHLSSKASVLRICLSLSLNDPSTPFEYFPKDDKNGFEISVSTLFGEFEVLYVGLIYQHYGQKMDKKMFIKSLISHIERGMVYLYSEFATTNSTEDLIIKLVEVYK